MLTATRLKRKEKRKKKEKEEDATWYMKRDGNDIASSSYANKGLIPAASLSTRFLVPLVRLVRDREKRVWR